LNIISSQITIQIKLRLILIQTKGRDAV
jgi:hypothetical protein